MFIPYPFYWDDVPIDISFVFERKTGRETWIFKVEGELLFEDGTKAVFLGQILIAG